MYNGEAEVRVRVPMAIEPVPGGSPGAPSGGRKAGAGDPALKRIIKWIHKRYEELAREMDRLMELEAFLEGYELVPRPGEKPARNVEAIGFKVGAIFKGHDYLRAVFEDPQEMPREVRDFLEALDEMLKAPNEESRARAREKVSALRRKLEERIEKIEKEVEGIEKGVEIVDHDGTVFEVVVEGVEPDDGELLDALELALKASYMIINRDKILPPWLQEEKDEEPRETPGYN